LPTIADKTNSATFPFSTQRASAVR